MKTLWSETRHIDRSLNGLSSPQENLLHTARQIARPDYAEAVLWQKKVYPIVKLYGQNKLRKEMDEVFYEVFQRPSFRLKILKLFTGR